MHSLIPEQFARFKKVESWQDAQEKSIGYQAPSAYGNVGNFFDAFQKFSNRGVDAFSLNELALIKALEIALRNIDQNRDVKVIDFGGSLGNHYHLAKEQFYKCFLLVGRAEKANITLVNILFVQGIKFILSLLTATCPLIVSRY